MGTEIAEEFVSTLIGTVPGEYLNDIKNSMVIFFNDYDIHKKCTDVVVHESIVPAELKKYLISMKIGGASDRTIDGYELILSNFFKATCKKLGSVNSDDLLIYLANYKIKRKVSDRTLDHYRIVLNSFFEWCVTNEVLLKNPCKKIKPIKNWKEQELALTDFQVESIRNRCATKRDLAIVDFLLSTGCRVSEMINIKLADIDFKGMKLVVTGKGNKKRTVYINGRAAHSIEQYLKGRADSDTNDLLFCSLRKPYGKLTKEAVEKVLKAIGKQVGIPGLHPHQFRRTMASDALKRGMDITIVQKILGHENIGTTMRYINISQEDVENAHRRFVA